MTTRSRILLSVIAGYPGAFGPLDLFTPALAERIAKAPPEPSFRPLAGLRPLVSALVALFAAGERLGSRTLSPMTLSETADHVR